MCATTDTPESLDNAELALLETIVYNVTRLQYNCVVVVGGIGHSYYIPIGAYFFKTRCNIFGEKKA